MIVDWKAESAAAVQVGSRATSSTDFLDAVHPDVSAFARARAAGAQGSDALQRLFAAVRDELRYDPFVDYGDPECYRASSVLRAGRGFCIGKAAVLAACARVVGLPSLLGFADVRNHLATPKLLELIGGDMVVWHGYAVVLVNGRWVELSPAFDRQTCERLETVVVDFNGNDHALLQPVDVHGKRHMEYVRQRGVFSEVPFELLSKELLLEYPRIRALVETRNTRMRHGSV
ncbi:MAG: hypothetical protein RJA70_1514 [Pseudomonadota bacterium]|jgi:transglutaminase-like putative cysteine protease